MIIGIDARSISIDGGVKNYLINLINHLSKIDSVNKYFIYYESERNFGTFQYKNFKEIVILNKRRFLIPFWEQIKLRKQLIKDEVEVFHGTKNTIPLFLPKKMKKIVTIHDLTPFILSGEMGKFDELYWKTFIPLSAKKADKIISISNSTSKDIKKLLGFKNKIKVVLLGNNMPFIRSKIKRNDFFIIIGALRPRKNLERIILSFKRFIRNFSHYKLFILGKNLNYFQKITNLILREGLNDRVFLKGFISNQERDNLYLNAKAFLFLSLYEGFGLPILEAQSCGCPVITSNISSMPEVAGKGAILVNPYNISEIANAMEKVVTNTKLCNNLIKEGYKNVKRFSWEKCAIETLKIYNEK